jgi:hypothetical protein
MIVEGDTIVLNHCEAELYGSTATFRKLVLDVSQAVLRNGAEHVRVVLGHYMATTPEAPLELGRIRKCEPTASDPAPAGAPAR